MPRTPVDDARKPHRVRRSPETMEIHKILVHYSDRDMLSVDDDPTQTPRIRNPDLLHSDHALPPEPGLSTSYTTTDKDSTTFKKPSSCTSLTASVGLKINRKPHPRRRSPLPSGTRHQVSGFRVSGDGANDLFPVRFAIDGFGDPQVHRGFDHRLHRKTICQWHIAVNPFLR